MESAKATAYGNGYGTLEIMHKAMRVTDLGRKMGAQQMPDLN